MNNPPITGIADLDAYLMQLSLDWQSSTANNSGIVNTNTNTGDVADQQGNVIGYLYRYIDIKFADDSIGTNISDYPYGRSYFGVANDDTVIESTDPASYTWYPVDGGFGINKLLWVCVTGGRFAKFAVSETQPDDLNNWRVAPVRSVDLDNPNATFKQYMFIKFTNASFSELTNTHSSTSKYYGVFTLDDLSDLSSLSDIKNFEWAPFNGSTQNIYYRIFGGRNLDIVTSTYKPAGYLSFKENSDPINLDVLTVSSVQTIGVVSEEPLILQSPYQYLIMLYGDDLNGTNITSNPTGKRYFGIKPSESLVLDYNPTDYIWFDAGASYSSTFKMWIRVSNANIVEIKNQVNAPDATGWTNQTDQDYSGYPHYIDVELRTGVVVTDITSPADGRLNAVSSVNGVMNIHLDEYGQGRSTNGFTFNPATVAEINVDAYGRVVKAGALDQVYFSALVTNATANQTNFSISNAQPNQLLVFKNGMFLEPTVDFTRTSSGFTTTNACALSDDITAYYIRLIDGATSADKVPFNTYRYTIGANVTDITLTQDLVKDGSELLFINGILMVDSDYTYLGNNTGFKLKTALTGSNNKVCVVSFVYNNGGALIFNENYTERQSSSLITFPTQFYRNSHLLWLNGVLVRVTDDYTIPGSGSLAYSASLIGDVNISGQPLQFCSFNSAGNASLLSGGSAAVTGIDNPIQLEYKPTIMDMFKDMQKQIDELKAQIKV